MSAALANDSRARPNVLGSSTTDMGSDSGSSDALAHASFRIPRSEFLQPDRHHVADDDPAGAARLELHRAGGERIERSAPHVLPGPRPRDNDHRRRPARPADTAKARRE